MKRENSLRSLKQILEDIKPLDDALWTATSQEEIDSLSKKLSVLNKEYEQAFQAQGKTL